MSSTRQKTITIIILLLLVSNSLMADMKSTKFAKNDFIKISKHKDKPAVKFEYCDVDKPCLLIGKKEYYTYAELTSFTLKEILKGSAIIATGVVVIVAVALLSAKAVAVCVGVRGISKLALFGLMTEGAQIGLGVTTAAEVALAFIVNRVNPYIRFRNAYILRDQVIYDNDVYVPDAYEVADELHTALLSIE